MYTKNLDKIQCQKNVQKVVKKRNLWPIKEFKLACPSFKCLDFQTSAKYKYCIKTTQYKGYKNPKEHNEILNAHHNKNVMFVFYIKYSVNAF